MKKLERSLCFLVRKKSSCCIFYGLYLFSSGSGLNGSLVARRLDSCLEIKTWLIDSLPSGINCQNVTQGSVSCEVSSLCVCVFVCVCLDSPCSLKRAHSCKLLVNFELKVHKRVISSKMAFFFLSLSIFISPYWLIKTLDWISAAHCSLSPSSNTSTNQLLIKTLCD